MRKQIICFESNVELTIPTQNKIMELIATELGVNIEIGFIGRK